MRSATRRCGYFGAVGPPNSLAIAWGRCPQTPEIYRFGPGAWFRRRITVVSRTSICCAYHVNSPRLRGLIGTVPISPLSALGQSLSALVFGTWRRKIPLSNAEFDATREKMAHGLRRPKPSTERERIDDEDDVGTESARTVRLYSVPGFRKTAVLQESSSCHSHLNGEPYCGSACGISCDLPFRSFGPASQ
jgi:hypothetical protein